MEVIYNIDRALPEKYGALVVRLEEAEKGGGTYALEKEKRPLQKSTLRALATPIDRDVLDLLIKEEMAYLKSKGPVPKEESLPFNQIRIAYPHSIQALKLMAGTGKLHFQGRSLAADFFSQNPLYCKLETAPNGKIVITGHLKMGEKEIDIRHCDFVCPGPPHWFIQGIFLKMISTEISWKHLKQMLEPEGWIIEPHAKKDVLEDLIEEGNPLSPKILEGESINQVSSTALEPMPVLMLKDRLGSFADLWMDYGNGMRVPFHHPQDPIKNGKRQPSLEKSWEKDLIESGFTYKLLATSRYYCSVDKIAKSLSFLLEVGWTILDAQQRRLVVFNDADIQMKSDGGVIKASGKVYFDSDKKELKEVVSAYQKRDRFIPLDSGKIGLLPDRWPEEGLQMLCEEGEIVTGELTIKKHRFVSLGEAWQHPTITLDLSLEKMETRLKSLSQDLHDLPGEKFKGQLRPYQQHGLDWLRFLYDFGFHGILADDMGLGKTVQVLAFLSQLETTSPTLIVLPASLLFNWKREIERFLPGVSVCLHHGATRCKDVAELKTFSIILTSYALLRLDIALFDSIEFECAILDEAQMIKNPQTQIAQAAFQLKARFRLSITGTPIENHILELWSHFRFLMPDLLNIPDENDKKIPLFDAQMVQHLKKKVRPFLLRRTKEEVAPELPEKIEQVLWATMAPEQRQLYDQFLSGFKRNILKKVAIDGLQKHRLEILEALLRLRQICCHPVLAGSLFEEASLTNAGSAKMEALFEDMETIAEEGKKALIYSQFTSMLNLMAKGARERGWGFVQLDGSTPNREKVVKQFQDDPQTSFFLISLKAGGVGLNLTAADYVLLYEPWWNVAVENQAIDRAHRIGRKDTVIAKRYVVADTIEEQIMKLKENKEALVHDLFEEGSISGLNEAALQDLLEML